MKPESHHDGAGILRDFIAEKKVARIDLLQGKTDRFVRLRLCLIHRLRQAGLSKTEMARAMNKTRDGMGYWLSDEWKEADNAVRWNGIADGSGWDTETNSIVLKVCNEHKIYPAEFFGRGRDKRLTAARREAMRRLRGVGMNHVMIARLLRLNRSSVYYWLNPKSREYCRRSARASLARSKKRIADCAIIAEAARNTAEMTI